MTDNSKRIVENMQASFPHFYNVYDKSTILYNLLSIFGERYGARADIIDRLYAMIGIDSTYDEDLEHRWGSLLGIYRQIGESYDEYRSRLLIVYSSLAGGTAEAIKYAIASTIGITSNSDAVDKYIKVYDAWKYPYNIDENVIDTSYGHIICTVDLQANENITTMNDKIMRAINETKASGIYPYLLFIYTINEVAALSYNERLSDKISSIYESNVSIKLTDEYTDKLIRNDNKEPVAIDIDTKIWSNVGTNSSLINVNLITNIVVETDQCLDDITIDTQDNMNIRISDQYYDKISSSIFGEAVFGKALF